MNQQDRRNYLINYLLQENQQYVNTKRSASEEEQKRLLRSLMNVRMPGAIASDFIKVQDEYLSEVRKEKEYFVLTTNVDHCFQKAGFDKNRLFYTQGDYGLLQCSKPCCQETFDNEEIIREMVKQQKDMRIPTELIPTCSHCGRPLTTNLRADSTFVQDKGWEEAANRYDLFEQRHKNMHLVYLEIGVGFNTPGIIKYNCYFF